MKKNQIILCLLLAILLVTATACQKQEATPTAQPTAEKAKPTTTKESPPEAAAPTNTPEPPPTEIPPTAAPEPITLDVWWVAGSPDYENTIRGILDKYQEQKPWITVKTNFLNYSDYVASMGPALEAGTKIDVAFSDPFPPTLPNYIEGGYVTDLTQVAEEHGWREKVTPGMLDFYRPVHKDMIVGAPLTPALRGFFYNKKIMAELGGTVPKTVEELTTLAEKAKAAGYIPFGLGNQTYWASEYYWLNLAYGYLASGDWKSWYEGTMSCTPGISWSSEEIKKGLEQFVTWEKADYFNEGYNAIAEGDVHLEFSKGNMLMYYYSAMSENSNLLADQPDFEVGFFNFPWVTSGTPLLNMSDPGNVLIVPTTAEFPDEGIALIDWLLTPEVGRMLAEQGIVPAHNVDLSSAKVPVPWMTDELAGVLEQTPLNWINWSVSGLGDVTGPEVQRVLADEITIDEALKAFQEAYDKACPAQ